MSDAKTIYLTPIETVLAGIYGRFRGHSMAAHWVGKWELLAFIKHTHLNIKIHGIKGLDYVKRGLRHK